MSKFHYADGSPREGFTPNPRLAAGGAGFKPPAGNVATAPLPEEPDDGQPLTDPMSEKSKSGPAGVKVPAFLPWYDDSTGARIPPNVLRKMVSDPYVKSALFAKVIAVASLAVKVHPASKKSPKDKAVAAFVKWNLTERLAGGIPDLAWNIAIHGAIDGHSVNEKVRAREDQGIYKGKTVLSALKPKRVGEDLVLQVDEFFNVTGLMGMRFNGGVEFDPADFLIYRHLPLFGSPVGTSDLTAAYKAYWVLDAVSKLRLLGLNRASLGVLVGTYKSGSQVASLGSTLAQLSSANWAMVPEGVKIDVLELAAASIDVFESAEKKLIHEIYLAIRFAYLMALEGSVSDGAGNSQVHASSADQLVTYLATSIAALINNRDHGLVKPLVDDNYVVDEYPRVSLGAVDVNEQLLRMQVYTGWHALGGAISLEQSGEELGMEPPLDKADTLPGAPQAPAGGAAPGPGGPGGPPAAPMADDVSVLTQPVKLLTPAPAVAKATEPFRFAEDWRAYVTGQ